MERLEARICELAGHLTAATCQFLLLIADFDARKGWADWEMPSCAAWLSWKCQIASGTAREQVRVARALGALPAITAEFAAGRLSYAKVRALTRIATPETEHDLLEMATPMTANQMERFAQAHRRVTEADRGQTRPARQLTWNRVKDLDYVFRAYPPRRRRCRRAAGPARRPQDLEHPHDQHDNVSAERGPANHAKMRRTGSASALTSRQNHAWKRPRTSPTPSSKSAPTAQRQGGHGREPRTYQVITRRSAVSGVGDSGRSGTPEGAAEPCPSRTRPTRCAAIIQDGLALSLSTRR